jgi:hypothetical protein
MSRARPSSVSGSTTNQPPPIPEPMTGVTFWFGALGAIGEESHAAAATIRARAAKNLRAMAMTVRAGVS